MLTAKAVSVLAEKIYAKKNGNPIIVSLARAGIPIGILIKRYLKNDRLKILILGTEEFMFQPMLLGYKIEKKYKNAEVKFHATTRSPIEISDDTGYPLNSRFSLESFYEEGRDTFVYNLLEYDNVFIVTDCKNINEKGMINLISALEKSNNKNISLIKWGDGR